jgi:magnesium chelatase family protein
MDRFDIQIEVPAIPFEDLSTNRTSENSASIRSRVNTARRVQTERYKNDGIFYNSQLNSKLIDKYCHINAHQKKMMRNAFVSLNLSARAYGRILKVARTIADLEGTEKIQDHHLAEAIQYRRLDRQFWV